MGNTFTNLSVRRSERCGVEELRALICAEMARRGYTPTPDGGRADVSFALVAGESWLTLYSEALEFMEADALSAAAAQLSKASGEDALIVGCFDSDALFLSARNPAKRLDAWLLTGPDEEPDLRRKANISQWKKLVPDVAALKALLAEENVFAEDMLGPLGEMLGLPAEQSGCGFDALEDAGLAQRAVYLHFSSEAAAEAPRLVAVGTGGDPRRHDLNGPYCLLTFSFLNAGGAGCGVELFLSGTGVESGALSFPRVELIYQPSRRYNGECARLYPALQKRKSADGAECLCGAAELPLAPASAAEAAASETQRYMTQLGRELTVLLQVEGALEDIRTLLVTVTAAQTHKGLRWSVRDIADMYDAADRQKKPSPPGPRRTE